MAERRMFSNKIIDSDAFLDMPLSAQSLYFHLCMRADDDGFLNNAKTIQRMVGASPDDLKLLIAKRFILTFPSGIVVIKHWRMHNLLRKDRYNETQYQQEKSELTLKENGAYTDKKPTDNQMATTWQPTDNQMATQVSIVEVSTVKDSVCNDIYINNNIQDTPTPAPTPTYSDLVKKYGQAFVDERVERSKQYKGTDNIETVAKWCEEDFNKARAKPKGKANTFNSFTQRNYNEQELEKRLIANGGG